MRPARAWLTEEAERDLADIWTYVADVDGPERADDLLDGIEATCGTVARTPGMGHVPPELERVGVTHYREFRHKPYRILYETEPARTVVHAILDGRRDLASLLQRRLLR